MVPVPDLLAAIFLGCFLFGLVFSVATFFLGFDHGHDVGQPGVDGHDLAPGQTDVGHEMSGHDAGADHQTHHGPSYFSVQAIVAALTFFGGVGYAVSIATPFGRPFAILSAVAAAVIGWWLMFQIISFLYRRQTPWLRASDYDLVGTIAKVSSRITPGGTGEIIFTKLGVRRAESARSTLGVSLDQGTEVVVIRYEQGIAHVEPADRFFGLEPGSPTESLPSGSSDGEGGKRT